MIILGIPPLPRRQNLRHDFPTPPLCARLLCDLTRLGFLGGGVKKDSTSVLRPGVGALGVDGCGVVHAVEEGEEGCVGEGGGVEG